jgi:hypothetical protein
LPGKDEFLTETPEITIETEDSCRLEIASKAATGATPFFG